MPGIWDEFDANSASKVDARGLVGRAMQGDDAKRPDFSDRYNTKLSPSEEQQFQAWLKQQGRASDLFDYDMRGAWKAGASKSANGHFTDQFKKPNHPTFSTESQYNGVDGYQGGSWTQAPDRSWEFDATPTNVQMMGEKNLMRYFNDVEKGNQLRLPAKR